MWKFTSILLFIVMAALGSWVPQYFHELGHQAEDAAEAALAASQGRPAPVDHHSERDCPVCAAFHAPLFTEGASVHVMTAGEWLPFLSMEPVSQRGAPVVEKISCRGPPARAAVRASV